MRYHQCRRIYYKFIIKSITSCADPPPPTLYSHKYTHKRSKLEHHKAMSIPERSDIHDYPITLFDSRAVPLHHHHNFQDLDPKNLIHKSLFHVHDHIFEPTVVSEHSSRSATQRFHLVSYHNSRVDHQVRGSIWDIKMWRSSWVPRRSLVDSLVVLRGREHRVCECYQEPRPRPQKVTNMSIKWKMEKRGSQVRTCYRYQGRRLGPHRTRQRANWYHGGAERRCHLIDTSTCQTIGPRVPGVSSHCTVSSSADPTTSPPLFPHPQKKKGREEER